MNKQLRSPLESEVGRMVFEAVRNSPPITPEIAAQCWREAVREYDQERRGERDLTIPPPRYIPRRCYL